MAFACDLVRSSFAKDRSNIVAIDVPHFQYDPGEQQIDPEEILAALLPSQESRDLLRACPDLSLSVWQNNQNSLDSI